MQAGSNEIHRQWLTTAVVYPLNLRQAAGAGECDGDLTKGITGLLLHGVAEGHIALLVGHDLSIEYRRHAFFDVTPNGSALSPGS